jgi:hypothetical protein
MILQGYKYFQDYVWKTNWVSKGQQKQVPIQYLLLKIVSSDMILLIAEGAQYT